MYACMRHCCGKLTAPKAVSAKQGAFQTRPSIVGTPNGDIFVAWNELDESGKAIVVQKLSGGEKP
ncbi:MAG: hypothetical protein K8T89_18910 [Planctomycetes bacterium]|nr:hypothetical protein [Planctomycetota bacterium]